MIDYLMERPDISLEVDQRSLALGFNRRLKVEEIEAHLKQLVEIRSLIPNYLFEE
jgi:hypothetical protein